MKSKKPPQQLYYKLSDVPALLNNKELTETYILHLSATGLFNLITPLPTIKGGWGIDLSEEDKESDRYKFLSKIRESGLPYSSGAVFAVVTPDNASLIEAYGFFETNYFSDCYRVIRSPYGRRLEHAGINGISGLDIQSLSKVEAKNLYMTDDVFQNLKNNDFQFITEVSKNEEIDQRSETTYQYIIAALLNCISGECPGTEKHPSFKSEAQLIDHIDAFYTGYRGLSKSNLSRKFPEAKRKLTTLG